MEFEKRVDYVDRDIGGANNVGILSVLNILLLGFIVIRYKLPFYFVLLEGLFFIFMMILNHKRIVRYIKKKTIGNLYINRKLYK